MTDAADDLGGAPAPASVTGEGARSVEDLGGARAPVAGAGARSAEDLGGPASVTGGGARSAEDLGRPSASRPAPALGGGDRQLEVIRLGRVSYAEGTAVMQARVEARTRGEAPDTLFLLEHDPVLTLGRGGDAGHVLASEARLAELGIELVRTGRGGDVTYHGPGQVVGYPVVDLKPERQSVRRYINDLSQVMIDACADYGVTAGRQPDMVGAWIEPETPRARKIGAIGVRIAQWVTSHGFALNITEAPLRDFQLIVPCGIQQYGVTCLAREATQPPSVEAAMDRLEAAFRRHFSNRPPA